MTDDGEFILQGAIQSQAGTSSQNLAQAVGFPPLPREFALSFHSSPSLTLGIYSTGSTTNSAAAINAVRLPDGSFALLTSHAATTITMTATAAGAKVAVGAADTQILAANTSRRYAALVNTSAGGQRITITFGSGAAVIDQGITLYQGGSYEMSLGAGNLSLQEIRAIGSAAGAVLSVQEGT